MRKLTHISIFIIVFLIASTAGMVVALFGNTWIDFAPLEHYKPGKPTVVLDDTGVEWARFELDKRKPIQLDAVPEHLIQAFVAAEDWQFFSHSGVSFKGMIRSLLVNVYHGRRVQGASTITQQLVKLLFFDGRKTFSRKLKEQLYAIVVERQFTKEQILQAYLNHIYFGCGIYGVEAASQRFWNKSASDLTIEQSAMLAAVVKSPGMYCPLLCPLSGERRRNVVLHSMYVCNFISYEQYESAKHMSLQLADKESSRCAPHLKETLRQFLEDLVGRHQLYRGGLVVQTTINKKSQLAAEKAFADQCAQLREKLLPDIDGGLIAIDTRTGRIKALVGGFDFMASKFNRVVQARRQIGSTIKPLVCAAALHHGMSFADTMIDEPFQLEQNNVVWKPNNYDKKFRGQMTLASALSRSNNIVMIKIMLQTGAKPVVDLARNCCLSGPFHEYPSLALGTIDATLVEVAGMFNVFANSGVYAKPHYIRWIKDEWGTKIYKADVQSVTVIDQKTVSQVAHVLTHGLNRVRKIFPNEWIVSDAISKTGTTNDSRTCWFVGATPDLTTAIYIGCDDNRPMGNNVYPLRTAFPIWRMFNRAVPSARRHFIFDSSLHEQSIHEKTGELLDSPRDRNAMTILV